MYDLGMKFLKRICADQQVMTWHLSKLGPEMFKGPEIPVYNWVAAHVKSFHVLPQIETLQSQFPVVQGVSCPEPSSYYLDHVEAAYYHGLINDANLSSQQLLKADQHDWQGALGVLKKAVQTLTMHRHRTRIMELKSEGPKAVVAEYHGVGKSENICHFGWDYLDHQSGGVGPGDVVSFVGRPAQGKTWMMLYIALHNWRFLKKRVMFVSMEMTPLAIAQRVTSMYAHQPFKQLKTSGFSSATYEKFIESMKQFKTEDQEFYVVDGNLAVGVDEIYDMADMLGCQMVVIDGAYLLSHPDLRIDRFTRVAENVRRIKRVSTELKLPTFCSWQFARSAVKGKHKDDQKKAGMEDIGMSDEIPQVSSVVLAMDQEESVETMLTRIIRMIKGRNGEIGQFKIQWLFDTMEFDLYQEPEKVAVMEHI